MNEESNIPPTPLLVKCPFCGYKWWSKAKLDWVTCSNCNHRFDKRKNKVEL
ncbi:MAG: hypothetical protein QW609_04205 [Candidatus Aenigmatarchaeota archaeon]